MICFAAKITPVINTWTSKVPKKWPSTHNRESIGGIGSIFWGFTAYTLFSGILGHYVSAFWRYRYRLTTAHMAVSTNWGSVLRGSRHKKTTFGVCIAAPGVWKLPYEVEGLCVAIHYGVCLGLRLLGSLPVSYELRSILLVSPNDKILDKDVSRGHKTISIQNPMSIICMARITAPC